MRSHLVINRRHPRAQQITHLLMHIIRRHVDFDKLDPGGKDRIERDLFCALQDQLWCDGAQMITEGDRIAAGLPPRNVEGLTVDELVAIESRLLLSLLQPGPTFTIDVNQR